MKTGTEGRDLHDTKTEQIETRKRALERELRELEAELTWRWAALCDHAFDTARIRSSQGMPRAHERPGGLAEIEQEYPHTLIYEAQRDADDRNFRAASTVRPKEPREDTYSCRVCGTTVVGRPRFDGGADLCEDCDRREAEGTLDEPRRDDCECCVALGPSGPCPKHQACPVCPQCTPAAHCPCHTDEPREVPT